MAKRIGTKRGSCTLVSVEKNTWKKVAPGSVSWPDMIFSSASRCSGVRAHVHQWQRLAVALMDRTRPGEQAAKGQAIET